MALQKTSLMMDEELYRKIRRAAVEADRKPHDVINEALTMWLALHDDPDKEEARLLKSLIDSAISRLGYVASKSEAEGGGDN